MTIVIEEKSCPIHLSFQSLPLGFYLAGMKHTDPMQRLAGVSNIPIEQVNKLSFDSLAQLFEAHGYVDKIELLGEPIEPYDIGNDSWGKFERAKLLAKEHSDSINIAVSIATTYTGENYLSKPCLEVWQKIMSYMNGFVAFNEKYKRLNDWKPTPEQQIAGIDRFEQFGIMPNFYEVRKLYPTLTDDEVWDLKAEVIYYKFLIDFEKSEFERTYADVVSKKNNLATKK